MTQYLVRFGNHWLLTDQHQTEIQWITDRSVASRHPEDWVARFQLDMAGQYKRVEVFTEAEASAMAEREREDKLKSAWFGRFESRVRETYEKKWTSNGFWCKAHMLHGQGLSVEDAVDKLGDSHHLRLTRKAVSV